MRVMIWVVGALLMFATQVASFGCSSGESTVSCDENGCDCSDRTSCDLDCVDVAACQPTCTAIKDECRAACTAEDCEFRCHSAEICEGLCGDNCYAACSSVSGICRVETGNNSEYNCTNTPTCAAEIGEGSVVNCLSVDSCNVRCQGTCTVICLLTGTCAVECIEGARLDCGQGLFTCGMPCPGQST